MLFQWLVSAIAIGVAAYILPGVSVTVEGALVAAVVLGLFNIFLKPILIFLTLPITIVTLGLFWIVVNALLVYLTASIVPGFTIPSFWMALLFAVVLSLVNWLFHVWEDA